MDDISDLITVESIGQLCPVCDNVIAVGEDFMVVTAHGYIIISHEMCVVLADDEEFGA